MLKSLQIKQFRGFESIEMPVLAQVNLIAGRNNAGKTALLEATYLMLRPEEPMILKDLLSASRKVAPGYVASLADVWQMQAFEGRDPIVLSANWQAPDMPAVRRIRSQLSLGRPTSVQTTAKEATERAERLAGVSLLASNGGPKQVRVDYLAADLTPNSVGLRDNGGAWSADVGAPVGLPSVSLLLPEPWNDETKKRNFDIFSELSLNGRDDELVHALRPLEPRLQRLILNTKGMWPALFANLGGKRAQMLNMLGDGMTRLIGFLLAIEAQRGGVLLIDEIENGFHHEVLPDVWRAIRRWAQDAQVQIIATTHSLECIAAADTAFQDAAEELLVIRLDRAEGSVAATSFDGKARADTLAFNFDMR